VDGKHNGAKTFNIKKGGIMPNVIKDKIYDMLWKVHNENYDPMGLGHIGETFCPYCKSNQCNEIKCYTCNKEFNKECQDNVEEFDPQEDELKARGFIDEVISDIREDKSCCCK